MNNGLDGKEVIDMNTSLLLASLIGLSAISFFGGIIVGAIWMGEGLTKDIIKLLNKQDKES